MTKTFKPIKTRRPWLPNFILFCQHLCYLRLSYWAVQESIWCMLCGPLVPFCSEIDSHGSSVEALEYSLIYYNQ